MKNSCAAVLTTRTSSRHQKIFPTKMNPLQLFFSSPMVQDEDWKRHTHTSLSLFLPLILPSHIESNTHTHLQSLKHTHTHAEPKQKKTKSWVSAHFYLTFKPASSPKPSSFSFFLSLLVQMTAASKKPLQSLSVIMCLPVRTMVVRAQFDFCSLSLPLFLQSLGLIFHSLGSFHPDEIEECPSLKTKRVAQK